MSSTADRKEVIKRIFCDAVDDNRGYIGLIETKEGMMQVLTLYSDENLILDVLESAYKQIKVRISQERN